MSYEENLEQEKRFNKSMEQLDIMLAHSKKKLDVEKELREEIQELKQENERLKHFQEKGWEQVTSKKTLVCLFVVFSILLYGV